MNKLRNIERCITYSRRIFFSPLNLHRPFQTGKCLSAKMFMEYENKYAYSIMENKGYAIPLDFNIISGQFLGQNDELESFLKRNWSREPPHKLFETFSQLSIFAKENKYSITNPIFDDYIDILTDNIKLASEKELEELFYALANWPDTPSIRSRNLIEVWTALDDECLKRYREWSLDEMIKFITLFYLLNASKASDFTLKALNRLATKGKQLTPDLLVQTLFFIGIIRTSPFDMHNLEIQLEDNFANFTIEELAIMSMGFFKSKTPIRNTQLVNMIVDKILQNTKDIHEVALAALLKLVRYSTNYPKYDKIYQLLDELQHEVPRLSIMCCVHIALLGTTTLTLHKGCLDNIAQHFTKNISKARLKDMERMVLTYGMFNYTPKDNALDNILNELRNPERNEEFEKHGRKFACCVSYLSLHNLYPDDLINKVLDLDYLEKYYGKNGMSSGREILTLNNVSQIFCKDKMRHSLKPALAVHLAKKYTDYVPNENYRKQFNITEQMVLDIKRTLCNSRGGPEYVLGDHILTHHQRGDIIICNDNQGQPVTVESFPSRDFGVIHRPPNNQKWIVLVIAGRNTFLRDSNQVHGPLNAKLRELRALGWYAGLVPWTVWSSLKDQEEKNNYLSCLISEITQNKINSSSN